MMLVGDVNPCNLLRQCNCLIKTKTYIKTYIIPLLGSVRYGLLGMIENNPPFNNSRWDQRKVNQPIWQGLPEYARIARTKAHESADETTQSHRPQRSHQEVNLGFRYYLWFYEFPPCSWPTSQPVNGFPTELLYV